jgi:type I restriction enzyme S subunit
MLNGYPTILQKDARLHEIPDDWKLTRIGKACKIRNTLRKPLSDEERRDMHGPFPYYGPTSQVDSISEYRLDGTYALIGEDGDHFLKYDRMSMTQLIRGKCNVNNHAHIIEGTKTCSTEWVFHFFRHRNILHFLSRQGAGRYKLNKEALSQLPILVPPLAEQQKIAAILSTWDRAIELTEKLIAAKQNRKQALMQQLLTGKVRLPGFEKTKWKKCHLDDVAKNSTRRNVVPTDDRIVYSVTNSVGMVPMDEDIIGESIDRYKTVSPFDFAYNPKRINVGSIAMWNGDEEVLVSPDYVVFRCGSKLDAQFLNHFRTTHYWRHFVNRAGGGSVRVRIYFSDLGSMKLNLPPIDEQRAIAEALNAQDSEIDLLSRRLNAMKRQKKGLMQQLLTGKIRVAI